MERGKARAAFRMIAVPSIKQIFAKKEPVPTAADKRRDIYKFLEEK
jgi:hypothetical protein